MFIFVAAYKSHIGLEDLDTGADDVPVFEEGEAEGNLEGGEVGWEVGGEVGLAEGEYVTDVGWTEGLEVEARTGAEVGITEGEVVGIAEGNELFAGAEVGATDGHTASFTDFDGLKVY